MAFELANLHGGRDFPKTHMRLIRSGSGQQSTIRRERHHVGCFLARLETSAFHSSVDVAQGDFGALRICEVHAIRRNRQCSDSALSIARMSAKITAHLLGRYVPDRHEAFLVCEQRSLVAFGAHGQPPAVPRKRRADAAWSADDLVRQRLPLARVLPIKDPWRFGGCYGGDHAAILRKTDWLCFFVRLS